MATVGAPATPQRLLPGAFAVTPAHQAPQAPFQGQGTTIFAAQAATLRQNPNPPVSDAPAQSPNAALPSLSPIERAAKAINANLNTEQQFPSMESYVQQGISGEYEQPSNPALEPFQKLKLHDIPPRLLEQANQGHMAMQIGVFAPLAYAWIALDNCLYLWDYSSPNPEILGFEENKEPITAVKLVVPKPGVFIEDIKHIIVVCTATDMLLLGVALQTTSTGARDVHLYNTRMSISIRGLSINMVEASRRTGRLFFSGRNSDDIFEFHYQQEEGWFRGKCQRICHTQGGMSYLSEHVKTVGSFFSPQQMKKFFEQMVIDDSRSLLYTLSNTSEIRVWLVKDDSLEQGIMRPFGALLQNTGHFNSRTELLTGREVRIKSISTIPAQEAEKISLMALTNTGCRLYISLTRGYGNAADAHNPPTSMQILHIRFPPKDPDTQPSQAQHGQTALTPYNQGAPSQVDNTSTALLPTIAGYRFSPGYWMAARPDAKNDNKDRVFCAAPDSARLRYAQNVGQQGALPFIEHGQWIDLPTYLTQIEELTEPFAAAASPRGGFGNELAVQFDTQASEFALVTSSGIQTMRKRRLVDMFAGMMKYGSGDEDGTEGHVKRFVRTYGRAETCATALAVACGKGVDVTDNHTASVSDPDVIERARKVFIEHGGAPEYNTNAVVDANINPADSVTPSPRHAGIALYISRLIRTIWGGVKVIAPNDNPGLGGQRFVPSVNLGKLRDIQRDVSGLSDFLDRNRSFIEGLAGPQGLSRVKSRQEEIALRGEHQAMNSIVKLLETLREGISFVLVLFDERVEDILALLSDESRGRALDLTFEKLFTKAEGQDLGKELVRAIVNRNIANGSNVDTVAETLRRRCGSFCSADDVVIFKAQEQVKRAQEAGEGSDAGRQLLNESQRLFQKCAGNLRYEYLVKAVEDYVGQSFYAGAIQLSLTVAHEKDKSKRALAWIRDARPPGDNREPAYEERRRCYDLVLSTINALDAATANAPEMEDGKYTLAMKRRSEAYDIINSTDDIVFLTYLYDWYVGPLNQPERLLDIVSPYVVEYLRQRSQDHKQHNDLLWRYYAHHKDYLQAAGVQLDLARSHFEMLTLSDRILYLSRARTNASTRSHILTDARQNKQRLLREVSDLIEIAEVQQELLERIKSESRIQDEGQKAALLQELNSEILPVTTLFTKYADPAKYHDICLILYRVADHRNPGDIKTSWEQLVKDTSAEAIAIYGQQMKPWEAVGQEVRRLGRRLGMNPAVFPINILVPLLEAYAHEPRSQRPPETWAIDVMLDLEVPHETLLPVLESMFYANVQPFVGGKKRKLAGKMIYVIQKWFEASEKSGERVLFGSEENISLVQDCLASLSRDNSLGPETRELAMVVGSQVGDALR